MSRVRWLAILAATTARAKVRACAGSAKIRYWAARSDTFLGGAAKTVAINLPYMFKYTSGTSAWAKVCSACVETCTLPNTTTWRTETIGTRSNSRPFCETTRCSPRLPTCEPFSWR